MMRFLTPWLLIVGCTSNDLSVATGETGDVSETGLPEDSDSSMDLESPTWSSLAGNLTIASEAVDLAESGLIWRYFDSDLGEICAIEIPLQEAEVISPPDPAILAWWSLTEDPEVDATNCPLARPAQLELGLGTIDPSLAPALDASDIDDTASPYGLYARVGWSGIDEDTPLWIFGVAGTTEVYDGSVPAVTEGPLPDGTYELRALHLFAVP
jgi:hypothetical protein